MSDTPTSQPLAALQDYLEHLAEAIESNAFGAEVTEHLQRIYRRDSAMRHSASSKKPVGYHEILQEDGDAKTSKGRKYGYLTGICYLAPSNESIVADLCGMSTAGCEDGCLFRSGLAALYPSIIAARIAKTFLYIFAPDVFTASLAYDVALLQRRAAKANLIPAVRINGTSDVPKLAHWMAAKFPAVQFYDYTKLPKAWQRVRSNYHITFSHSESNAAECLQALQHGLNVAVVFDVKRGKQLPATYLGCEVIDGDTHDLRFLDGYQGKVIGLRAKGPAKGDCTGFVVRIAPLVQIQPAA